MLLISVTLAAFRLTRRWAYLASREPRSQKRSFAPIEGVDCDEELDNVQEEREVQFEDDELAAESVEAEMEDEVPSLQQASAPSAGTDEAWVNRHLVSDPTEHTPKTHEPAADFGPTVTTAPAGIVCDPTTACADEAQRQDAVQPLREQHKRYGEPPACEEDVLGVSEDALLVNESE